MSEKNNIENKEVINQENTEMNDDNTKSEIIQSKSIDRSVRNMRIAIAILMIIAIIMTCLVLIPPSGSLASQLTETDFNGDGTAIRVRANILNETNKPAFNIDYEIVVTDTDGNILGTTTDSIWMMLPGGKRKIEKFIYFDTAVDTGNVEIIVNGYVIGE